jgi:capsular polysaccharide biosynthesis protein
VPARYTLEVRDGRLVGDFGATVTPGGVLDYQTSGYFGIDGWREHPLFLHPTLGRIERVPGTVLSLTTRGTAVNYYHFLYDALARYGIFEESLPGVRPDAVVVPHGSGYQRALLELAGIDAPFVQPRAGVTVQADRLLVPSTPNQDLDAPPWVVQWLRDRLPAAPAADSPRRLYLTRGDQPNTRRYVQEPALWPWLEQRGFVRIDAGRFPVQEQIDLFAGAEVVVAPHGAALTNITFCRPGTRVLEMFAANYVHLGLWTIADAAGLDYRYLVADGDHRPGRPMTGNYPDVSIPVERVQEAVEKMLA